MATWLAAGCVTVGFAGQAALRRGGEIILGKTHTTEFALRATGQDSTYQLPRNPWDKSRIPGGSGESAVGVAAWPVIGQHASTRHRAVAARLLLEDITRFPTKSVRQ